jgi:hypothetical protein
MSGKLVTSCKICKLLHESKDTFIELHMRVLQARETKKSVLDWLNEAILPSLNEDRERRGEKPFEEFSYQNFARHFNDHISSSRELALVLTAKERKELGPDVFSYDDIIAIGQQQDAGLTEDQTDFYSLDHMVEVFDKLLRAHVESKADEEGNVYEMNVIELTQLQTLLKGQVQLKRDLSTIRKSNSIAGKAVEETAIELLNLAISCVAKAASEARIMVEPQTSTDFSNQVETLIRNRVKDDIGGEVKGLISRVKKRYKME